jgi:PBSX family phage terminase large subunit
VNDLIFVPQPTRQHLVRSAIVRATRSSARKRSDVEIVREIPKWAKPLRRRARFKLSSGGRGAGKSHFFAEELVERSIADPSLRSVCIREVQDSLQHSVKSLIEKKIHELGVGHLFTILSREIRHVEGTGLIVFQGMQDHTAESIKSLEGFGIAWVEEGQKLSKRSLDLLIPTIRLEDSEIWISWNPENETDAVDQFAKSLELSEPGTKGDAVRVHTTFRDNPHCPEVIRKEAARLEAIDPDSAEHIYGGGYNLGSTGRVYSTFSPKHAPEGNIDEEIEDLGGELLVGMDFNVNPMTAIIGQRVVDELEILDSLSIMTSNTEEMAAELKQRYPKRRIVVCPDPSGRAHKTSAKAGVTDFTILQNAGFEVRAPNAAPPVVDRINNTKAMFRQTIEEKPRERRIPLRMPAPDPAPTRDRRRIRIHPRATVLITALKSLVYKEAKDGTKTNQPDKTKGHDHPCDALDYLTWEEFNILSPTRAYGSSTHRT